MEIQLYEKIANPIDAITQIGAMFVKSGMFGCTQDAQGQVLALACLAEKKSPIQILREYHLIEGRLSDRADSMLAKFLAAGGRHKIQSRTPDLASVALTKDGQEMTFALSWEEIQKEPFVWSNKSGVLKKNYATPRARMQTMWARVISDGVRTMCPNIVAGVFTPEEIDDQKDGAETTTTKIFAEEPAKAPTKPKKEAAKVVEAEIVKTPEPAAATSTPEPAKVVAPQDNSNPELAPVQPVASGAPIQALQDPNTKRLTTATVTALQEAIGEANLDAALKWMIGKGWLKQSESFFNLNPDRANKVLTNPQGFLKQVAK